MRKFQAFVTAALIMMFLPGAALGQRLAGTITSPGSWTDAALYRTGGKLFVSDYTDNQILVYDSGTLAYLSSIPLAAYTSYGPDHMAVHEGTGTLYVALTRWFPMTSTTIAIIDADTYGVVNTISGFGSQPGLFMDESRGRLYVVGDHRTLTAIDVNTNTAVGSLDVGLLFSPSGARVQFEAGNILNPVTGELVFGCLGGDGFVVVNGPNLTGQLIASVGSNGWGGTWNPNENKLYITRALWNGYFIYDRDTGTAKIAASFNDGTSLFYSPATNRVYSGAEVNGDTTVIEGGNDAWQDIEVGGGLSQVGFVTAAHHAYFASSSYVRVLDEDTLTVVDTFPGCGSAVMSGTNIVVDQNRRRVFIRSHWSSGDSDPGNSCVQVIDDEPHPIVTWPNGGESLSEGVPYTITWFSTGVIANVKIEYSTDNGSTWMTIIASTPNVGTHAWTPPNPLSASCLVRITDTANLLATDVSNAVFSIVEHLAITVTAPNGGENWEGGSSHAITWTSIGTIANVDIQYSLNNGTNWNWVAAATPNTGAYAWTIPDRNSANCLIRIRSSAATSVSDMSDAVFTLVPTPIPLIHLNRAQLNFASIAGDQATPSQSVIVSNSGTGALAWTANPNAGWITASPGNGTGAGAVSIGVVPTGLAPGSYSSSVAFTAATTNSPQLVQIGLKVYAAGGTALPFGSFDSPIDGTVGVTGAIPVTGWVLDDIGVDKLEIWRDPVPSAGEVNSLYFIGNGLFVEGARPDIETGYPGYPMNYKAGWGYMLLTNFLPNHGNGTYKLYAIATDKDGHVFSLGTKTITCDNAHAQKPFGTIDTPAQGGTSSGIFFNFGWVLTPLTGTVPKDGHTITVYVDSVLLGNLSTPPNLYNAYRADVSGNFPGLNNTGGPGAGEGGPVGAFSLNTTGYANGVHSIFWIAYDDLGRGEGIGSRFFNILNAGSSPEPAPKAEAQPEPAPDLSRLPLSFKPVKVRTGFDLNAEFQTRLPGPDGILRIEIPEVNRMEVGLGDGDGDEGPRTGRSRFTGYLMVGTQLRPLPIGSTLDRRTGRFSWMPGPGFLGGYDLVFIESGAARPSRSFRVSVEIKYN